MYGIGSTPVIKDKENKDMFRDSLYWSKACVPGNAVNFFFINNIYRLYLVSILTCLLKQT